MPAQLDVFLHETPIGTITNLANDTNVFAFEESYRQDLLAQPLSFKAFRDPVSGSYRDDVRAARTRVHPYFSNLLPEGLLRTYLAERASVNVARDFPLLRLLGNDLPGALVLRDPSGSYGSAEQRERRLDDADATDERILRFSLAGVQLKFSAIKDGGRLTIPAAGVGGDAIVKLPDQRYAHVPENEFAMMTFARSVGIDIPQLSLCDVNSIGGLPSEFRNLAGPAFVIERFDRTPDGSRIHTEDFAQANSIYPEDKYRRFNFDMLVEQVADAVGLDGALEIIRRIVFTVGIGNGDMHAKNWSIIYRDGKTPSLAPAYDFVSTIVYIPQDDLGVNLAGTKAFVDIADEHFVQLAKRARLPTKPVLYAVHDIVARMRERWPVIAPAMPMSEAHRAIVTAHMNAVPLFNPSKALAP